MREPQNTLCKRCPFQKGSLFDDPKDQLPEPPDGYERVFKRPKPPEKEYTVVIVRTVRASYPEDAADAALTNVGMHSHVEVYDDSQPQETLVHTMATGNDGQYFRERTRK